MRIRLAASQAVHNVLVEILIEEELNHAIRPFARALSGVSSLPIPREPACLIAARAAP